MSARTCIGALGVALLLAACTGKVVMTPATSDEAVGKAQVEGVIVYRAQPLIEVDELTQVNLPQAKGAPPITSDKCRKQAVRKLVSVADWEHPYRLHYDHGFLETYTFGATLTSDGILTAINTQSTPDQGKTIANLASAASSAAGAARSGVPEGAPDCTITPAFVGYERPPTASFIRDYGKTVVVP